MLTARKVNIILINMSIIDYFSFIDLIRIERPDLIIDSRRYPYFYHSMNNIFDYFKQYNITYIPIYNSLEIFKYISNHFIGCSPIFILSDNIYMGDIKVKRLTHFK